MAGADSQRPEEVIPAGGAPRMADEAAAREGRRIVVQVVNDPFEELLGHSIAERAR